MGGVGASLYSILTVEGTIEPNNANEVLRGENDVESDNSKKSKDGSKDEKSNKTKKAKSEASKPSKPPSVMHTARWDFVS